MNRRNVDTREQRESTELFVRRKLRAKYRGIISIGRHYNALSIRINQFHKSHRRLIPDKIVGINISMIATSR